MVNLGDNKFWSPTRFPKESGQYVDFLNNQVILPFLVNFWLLSNYYQKTPSILYFGYSVKFWAAVTPPLLTRHVENQLYTQKSPFLFSAQLIEHLLMEFVETILLLI